MMPVAGATLVASRLNVPAQAEKTHTHDLYLIGKLRHRGDRYTTACAIALRMADWVCSARGYT